MATLWQKQTSDTLYEVRSAGRSVRLYTNGVFHSQFNPHNSVTGNVWDLLTLPVFLFPMEQPLRVLLLGVGGGAVIRQLQQWRGNCDITGIELNPVHLSVARRFFGVNGKQVQLVQGDARDWVGKAQPEQYDLIIDDLFGHADGEPQRAIAVTRQWATSLRRMLTRKGVVVTNFGDRRELLGSAYHACADLRRAFPMQWQLSTPLYENRIGVFGRTAATRDGFRSRIRSVPELNKAMGNKRLRFRVVDLTAQK